MTDYSDLVRCLRDCFSDVTDTECTCNCDNCLMKDKIVEYTYDDGQTYDTDYTICETALALSAADAIEELMRKLESRESALISVVGCLGNSSTATADVLNTTEDLIT